MSPFHDTSHDEVPSYSINLLDAAEEKFEDVMTSKHDEGDISEFPYMGIMKDE